MKPVVDEIAEYLDLVARVEQGITFALRAFVEPGCAEPSSESRMSKTQAGVTKSSTADGPRGEKTTAMVSTPGPCHVRST